MGCVWACQPASLAWRNGLPDLDPTRGNHQIGGVVRQDHPACMLEGTLSTRLAPLPGYPVWR
jgi:hypothetical protein